MSANSSTADHDEPPLDLPACMYVGNQTREPRSVLAGTTGSTGTENSQYPLLLRRGGLYLFHVFQIIHGWVFTNLDPVRTHKDSVLQLRGLSPVPRAGNAAIILSHWLVKLDPDPSPATPWDLRHLAHVLDDASARILTADAATLANLNASAQHLLLQSVQPGPLVLRSVGIEASQLLSFFPGQDRVGLLLVLLLRQDVLVDARRVDVIGASARGSSVLYLSSRSASSDRLTKESLEDQNAESLVWLKLDPFPPPAPLPAKRASEKRGCGKGRQGEGQRKEGWGPRAWPFQVQPISIHQEDDHWMQHPLMRAAVLRQTCHTRRRRERERSPHPSQVCLVSSKGGRMPTYMQLCVGSQGESAQLNAIFICRVNGDAFRSSRCPETQFLRRRRNAGDCFKLCLELTDGP